jgi:GH24 family phage-related lysozyme (muramidase)
VDKGIELIKKWEGLELQAYRDPIGIWTIGYGVTRINGRPVKERDVLASEYHADTLLKTQIKAEYLPALEKIPVWRKLNINQKGALLSFAWNLGANFYGASGFETITRALKDGRLDDVPDAMMLYVKAGGKTLQGLVNRRKDEGSLWLEPVEVISAKPPAITITGYPEKVELGEAFTITGTIEGFNTVPLRVMADNKWELPPATTMGGKFDYQLQLTSPGDRRISFEYGNDKTGITIKAGYVEAMPANLKLTLTGSVGAGGKNNEADVKAAQAKLNELGFTLTVDGIVGDNTIKRIKLFQSIIAGASRVGGDGRVDVNGITHRWLNADNAPRWQIMPDTNRAIGFRNQELEETWDHHDYGTSWLAGMVLWIAKDYQATYRDSRLSVPAPFSINDASLPTGGNTPDHSGHETGLAVDIFLPRKDGLNGGIDYLDQCYDRKATEAMLQSINRCPTINKSRIYFNDPYLVNKGLCRSVPGHHHHIHVEVKVPPIQG